MISERAQHILNQTNHHPAIIGEGSESYHDAAQNHCENMIGTTSIPVGVVGPLHIRGQAADGTFVIPMATTEGCLVASTNRGAKAINQAGGAVVESDYVGITRAPVFLLESVDQGQTARTWIAKHRESIAKSVEETSRYLKLLDIECTQVGLHLFVKFFFDAKDAMGMNMAVFACDHVIKTLFEPELKLRCVAVSGNLCTDKKPAMVNALHGRGFRVRASAEINHEILEKVLKTNAEALFETYHAKINIGSSLAGSLGHNAHSANIVAALYLATGQDIAHTVEGSLTMTSIEKTKQGILISVHLPSVVCGVVGGGTNLPKQRDALQLLGIEANPDKPGTANKAFAEVIGASVLAGELSLLAALSSGSLARAHRVLGRK